MRALCDGADAAPARSLQDLARKIMDTAGEQQREVREAEGHAQGETAEDKEGRDLLASALRRQSKRRGHWRCSIAIACLRVLLRRWQDP